LLRIVANGRVLSDSLRSVGARRSWRPSDSSSRSRDESASRAGRARGQHHSLPRWLVGPRRLALTAAAYLLVAASATAAAITTGVLAHDRPVTLFRISPGGASLAGLHETVIPSTVHRAETFTVPGVGRLAFWVATTHQHGICTALRLPGSIWSGFNASPADAGGGIPGCSPAYAQVHRAGKPARRLPRQPGG